MAGIDQAALAAAVAGWGNATVEILVPSPQTRAVVPEAWWSIAESVDPEERKDIALALWNSEFLALVPRFSEALRSALLDVRVAQHSWQSAPSLDYVLRAWDGEPKVWMGEDPRTFGPSEPWDTSTYPFPGSQRLLLVTEYVGHPYLLTSAELPPGTAVTYFEPDFEVTPFGEALDEFLNKPLGY